MGNKTNERNVKKMRINPTFLLSVYAVLIIGLLTILIDNKLFDSQLKHYGPSDPHDYLWFTLLFTLPHIFASFFGFLEKTYLDEYGSRLLKGARYIALATIVLPLISLELTFFVFAIYTMSHVFLQQSGISKSLMRGANKSHRYWQWIGVLISTVLYIDIYSDIAVNPSIVFYGLGAAMIAYLFFGFKASRASKTRQGTLYFWATCSMPILSGVFLWLGYPILVIAVPRVIHDLTAFVFYLTHAHNRFLQSRSNIIYKVASRIGIPVTVASPLLAIAIAYPLQAGNRSNSAFMMLMFIFLFHYFIEGFMWKRGSLHRKQIKYTHKGIDLL